MIEYYGTIVMSFTHKTNERNGFRYSLTKSIQIRVLNDVKDRNCPSMQKRRRRRSGEVEIDFKIVRYVHMPAMNTHMNITYVLCARLA